MQIMDDYGYADDQYQDDSTQVTDDQFDYAGDDEVDEEILDDFTLPEEDLNGLHIVDEDGEEKATESDEKEKPEVKTMK